ncbi:uncharacterized protein LOC109721337 isoform X2 [Ananas comosus]|nr:uncharacterized protein LOC109721337 isoform X2 [Ananas comosus]
MLQRASSIFYIGEECSEASNEFGGANAEVSSSRLRPENAVGLRLLMQQPRREGRVVMKSEVKLRVLPESNENARQDHKSFQRMGFLKACFLCHKELSLQKDVFMYK